MGVDRRADALQLATPFEIGDEIAKVLIFHERRSSLRAHYLRFIESKNSLLVFVSFNLSIRNSTAGRSSMPCSSLRRIHIRDNSSSLVISSSRRVPERRMLIDGNTRFSEILRSRCNSMLPVPLNSS